jgi:hypothetical protein
MAATRIIEEERGTFSGTPRGSHQGYWAGDFSTRTTAPSGFGFPAEYVQDDAA